MYHQNVRIFTYQSTGTYTNSNNFCHIRDPHKVSISQESQNKYTTIQTFINLDTTVEIPRNSI